MRRAAVVLASLLVLLAAPSCGRREEASDSGLWARSAIHRAKRAGRLVVLMEAQFKPFTYREDGELKGFDVDLARAIAAEMKVDVEFREKGWGLLASELIAGKGDLVISGVTATPERALECSFSEPYFLTRTIALLGKPRADAVRTVADLDSPARRIVAQKGSTGEVAARRHLPRADLATYDTEAACALEVVQGRADAFVYDEWQVRAHAKEDPESTRVLDETLSIEPYAIECRKGDPDTLGWLDLVLQTMKRDGRLAALYRKHLPGIPVPEGYAPR